MIDLNCDTISMLQEVRENSEHFQAFKIVAWVPMQHELKDNGDILMINDFEKAAVRDLYGKFMKRLLNKCTWAVLKNKNVLNSSGAKLALRKRLNVYHLNTKNQRQVNKKKN